MIAAIFRWLETRTDSFPEALPERPPATLFGFILHYSKPFGPLLLASSLFATVVALIEVSLFAFVGKLVDWLSAANRQTFWEDHWLGLAGMGALVLLVLPFLKFWYEAVIHQGLIGNFAMRTRWQAHRYVLRQSMEFFQNDFAGRVATKVMQTALGVREVVMKVSEVLLYVGVYFTGALVLFASSDLRLAVPLILWLGGYILALRYFIPRLQRDLEGAGGCPLAGDRPGRRQLYQHRHGEDVRPCRPRGSAMRAKAWTSSSAPSIGRCALSPC